MELYGEGLERIMAAVDDEGPTRCGAARDDGVVASLLLMHGLYPGPARGPRARGARQRAAVHGVPRRQRRAARRRRRGRRSGSRATAAAARRPRRRSSWGSGRRSRRPRRTSRGSRSRACSPSPRTGRRPARSCCRWRGAARRRAPAPAPARSHDEEACELCRLRDLRRAQAPDPPRRAPDRVRVRDLLGAALGRRRVPAGRQPPRLARGASRSPTSSGRRSDPDRAGVLHDQLGDAAA